MSKRARLTEKFIEALHSDWEQHGSEIIEKLRLESPKTYAEIVARLCPVQQQVEISEPDVLEQQLSGMTNRERIEFLKDMIATWETEEAERERMAQMLPYERIKLIYEREQEELRSCLKARGSYRGSDRREEPPGHL
jgi:hypothetical protein